MGKGARLRSVDGPVAVPSVPVSDAPTKIPIEIPADKYWELRTRAVEHLQLMQRHQAEITASKSTLDALLVHVGLDPARQYHLNDATFSAIETQQ